jgi:hypothetical protein
MQVMSDRPPPTKNRLFELTAELQLEVYAYLYGDTAPKLRILFSKMRKEDPFLEEGVFCNDKFMWICQYFLATTPIVSAPVSQVRMYPIEHNDSNPPSMSSTQIYEYGNYKYRPLVIYPDENDMHYLLIGLPYYIGRAMLLHGRGIMRGQDITRQGNIVLGVRVRFCAVCDIRIAIRYNIREQRVLCCNDMCYDIWENDHYKYERKNNNKWRSK